jgi:hypothetical protein
MLDHYESERQSSVLGLGTQAERRQALVARLREELRRRDNYLPESSRPWRAASIEVPTTIWDRRRG